MPNSTLRVYTIPYAFRSALEQSVNEDTGEFLPEAEARIKALVQESRESILSLAGVTRELELEAKVIREIADEAFAREAALLKRAQRYREYLIEALEAVGEYRVNDPRLSVAIRTNPPSVHVVAVDEIPVEYLRVIPEHREPDKTAIRATLKLGQPVPGCELISTRRLEIK